MNNKRYTAYGRLLLLPALLLLSCSQDDQPGGGAAADDSAIVFRVSLADAGSRSNATTVAGNLSDGFYVSAICPEDDASSGNALNMYFDEQFATPLDEMPGYYGMYDEQTSEQWVWSTTRHGKQGRLKFFAFYPSARTMRESAGVGAGYFGLANKSTKSGSTPSYDYRMARFKINTDITRHVDFVTATAEGSKRANADKGIAMNLPFEHQLCRVAFTAWGNTPNDIEIAGVRIGGVITESDFNFAAKPKNYASGDNTLNGDWVAPQVKDCVEYIFRKGDAVVKVGSGGHATQASAASIMGSSGWAMVIPADYNGWNHTSDASNANKSLYFGVLLRVKAADENKTLLYPYIEGSPLSSTVLTDDMTVIFLSIERATGNVMKRLYRSGSGLYFTDPGLTEPYALPATEEIRNYGWAAIPLSKLRWKPGYQYNYTLNYTDGVGVHDPADPYPGKPIISKILVSVTEGVNSWPMVYDFENGSEVNVTNNITIE